MQSGFNICRSLLRQPGVLLFAIFLGLTLQPPVASAKAPGRWVLVCNAETGLTDVSRKEIARLFLRRGDSVGGTPVEPVNMKAMEERLAFLSALTRLSPTLVERHFMEMKFRGEGEWPRMVEGKAEMLKLLGEDPTVLGWLGIADVESLTEEELGSIRLLKLEGLDYREGDYVLRAR